MNKKELSIIIVNFNTKVLLGNCLKSIVKNTRDVSYEIIVVDNASSDGSLEMLKKEFPDIKLISNQKNVGFAKANNQGITIANGGNILLLNSDTLILNNCFRKILDFIKAKEDAGIVGCKVLNPDKTLQFSCYHAPDFLTELVLFTTEIIKDIENPVTWYKYMKYWNHNKIREVACIAGCFFLVKRGVFDKVGLLDENIFLYYEDSEFCKRVRLNSDYKIYYYPYAEIIHLKGASSNNSNNYVTLKYAYKNAKYYLNKYYGKKTEKIFDMLCKLIWHIELNFFCFFKFSKKFNEKILMLKELLNS